LILFQHADSCSYLLPGYIIIRKKAAVETAVRLPLSTKVQSFSRIGIIFVILGISVAMTR